MEITLEAIISLIGLFVGGGGGAFFMWKYQRKKAKAEAETAEVDAAKELQDMYQQMLADAKADREDRKVQIEELRKERDHYKSDRNELRDRLDEMDKKMRDLQFEVARNGRQIELMRPFICTDLSCKLRQRGTISDIEALKQEQDDPNRKRPNRKRLPELRKPSAMPAGVATVDIEPSNEDL